MKGIETLPAPGENKPLGSSPARGEEAVSLGCSVPPLRLSEENSTIDSNTGPSAMAAEMSGLN